VLARDDLHERDHRRLGRAVAGGAGERVQRRARRHAHDRAAARGDERRQRRLRHEIRRPEVERELRLELLDRGAGHRLAGREAADEVDQGPQGRVLAGGGDLDHARRLGRVGQVGGDHLRALELDGRDVRHHDAVAARRERGDDRAAEAAGPAGDERGALHAAILASRPVAELPSDPWWCAS
jgi:hypothetical protein